jgi:hypothetical protein
MYKASHGVIFDNYTTLPIFTSSFEAVFMFVIGIQGIFDLFENNRKMLRFVSTIHIVTASIQLKKFSFKSIYQSYLQQRSLHLYWPLNIMLKSMVILQLA